jgi:hypothetical protein
MTSSPAEASGGGVRFVIENEFARVVVESHETGNGTLLRILDTREDREILLDALELESLAWARHRDLAHLLDPSHGRWRNADEAEGV